MPVYFNSKKSIEQFTWHPQDYILKVEAGELKAVKKGLWTWLVSAFLGLKNYQISTVLGHIKKNKDKIDDFFVANTFYDAIRGKVKKCVKPDIDESLRCFVEDLKALSKDTQICVESKQIIMPHLIVSRILSLNGERQQARVCRGFHDAVYKSQFHFKIFQPFKEEKEGLLAQLIAKAKKAYLFPYEDEQASQNYLECIRKELFALASEFENPPLENFVISYQSYKKLSTWIENQQLIKFFNKTATKFTNGSTFLSSLAGEPNLSLEDQAKQIRDFLKNCTQTELSLEGLKLTYLAPEISSLLNLKGLNLSGNSLKEIPEALTKLTNLERLSLFNNQIQEIPEVLTKLTNLKWLNLSFNQIKEIPVVLGNLTNLKWLNLSNNQIKEIPAALGSLTCLEMLSLSSNQIQEIPEILAKLTNLKKLDLFNNQVKEIPVALGNLINLKMLALSNNQIKEIPEALGSLINLKELSLFSNQIKEIPTALGNLINLEWFALSNNQVKEIPVALGNLINLKTIALNNNQIKEIPAALGNLTNLKRLALSNNRLKEVPAALGSLIRLKELCLFSNQIKEIPVALDNLTNLKELDLRYNQLIKIPTWILKDNLNLHLYPQSIFSYINRIFSFSFSYLQATPS